MPQLGVRITSSGCLLSTYIIFNYITALRSDTNNNHKNNHIYIYMQIVASLWHTYTINININIYILYISYMHICIQF